MDKKIASNTNPLFMYVRWGNLVTGIVIGGAFANKFGASFIASWQLEYNSIVVDYLKVILGAPSIALILFVLFFLKFYSAIDYFIRNLRINYKGVEATSQQAKGTFSDGTQVSEESEEEVIRLSKLDAQSIVDNIETLAGEKKSQQEQIKSLAKLAQDLADRSELFEFKYLNNVLVLNTKLVLRDLYNRGPLTRDFLINSIVVSPTVADKYSEQLAIHSVLLVNGLIQEEKSMVLVSEKGERYLKFIGLIQ